MLAFMLFSVGIGYLILAIWLSRKLGQSGRTPRSKYVRQYGSLIAILFVPFLDLPAIALAAPFICDKLVRDADAPIVVDGDGIYLGIQITCPSWCTDILWALNAGPRSHYIEMHLSKPIGIVEMPSGSSSAARSLYRLEVINDQTKCQPDKLRVEANVVTNLYKRDQTGVIRCIASIPIPERTLETALQTRYQKSSFFLFEVAQYTVGLLDRSGDFRSLINRASIHGSWIIAVWLPQLSEYKNIWSCPSSAPDYARLMKFEASR